MKMSKTAFTHYLDERKTLSAQKIDHILDSGKQWSLGPILSKGGSAFFPHTYLSACGDQVAAVVQGCLDSGTEQVIALGVLHPLSEALLKARKREQKGENIEDEESFGVLGPGVGGDRYWREEFSLLNFQFLWDEEVKRRGKKAPRLILRFPSLVAGQPDRLKGIEELSGLIKDSVVVATGDLCHHGRAYGMEVEKIIDFSDAARSLATKNVQNALSILKSGDYSQYFDYCIKHLNDAFDTGAVLRYLLGPLEGRILDLRLVDVSPLFEGNPSPSWVAASLVAMEKI